MTAAEEVLGPVGVLVNNAALGGGLLVGMAADRGAVNAALVFAEVGAAASTCTAMT
jgi:hypothetical protein